MPLLAIHQSPAVVERLSGMALMVSVTVSTIVHRVCKIQEVSRHRKVMGAGCNGHEAEEHESPHQWLWKQNNDTTFYHLLKHHLPPPSDSHTCLRFTLQCVSEKNLPTLRWYSSKLYGSILMTFGRNIHLKDEKLIKKANLHENWSI